jgi:hypothetical protein
LIRQPPCPVSGASSIARFAGTVGSIHRIGALVQPQALETYCI